MVTRLPPNPWVALPHRPPYVLPEDDRVLRRSPRFRDRFDFDLLPAPYQGHPDKAQVILLALNPGGRTPAHVEAAVAEERRRILTFESRTPFMSLDRDRWHGQGSDYWHKHLRALIDEVGLETVQQQVMVIQFYGYQSLKFVRPPTPLPSQGFSFALVREAAAAAKAIVIMRGHAPWRSAVPELKRTPVITLRNPRAASISPGNMDPDDFRELVRRLSN
jgi:hypothetical protein